LNIVLTLNIVDFNRASLALKTTSKYTA